MEMEIVRVRAEVERTPTRERDVCGFLPNKKRKLSASEALKMTVRVEYHDDDEEEWWGRVQRAVSSHPQANHFIVNDKQLLEFVGAFFVGWVLEHVKSMILRAKDSWLGPEYGRKGTLASYTLSLLHFVAGRLAQTVEDSPTDADAETGQGTRGGGQAGNTADQQGANGGLEAGDTGGTGGGTGEQAKEARDSGGRPPQGLPPRGKEPQNEYFTNVIIHEVVLKGEFVTPPHIRRIEGDWKTGERINDRLEKLKDRSKKFSQEPYVFSNYPRTRDYRPEDKDEREYVYMYHGTRSSSLDNFCQSGINPDGKQTEFSRGKAFYLTTSVRLAYEHVVMHKPGQETPRLTEARDTVSVLVFRVPVRIMRGLEPIGEGGQRLDCKHFSSSNIDKWSEFCVENFKLVRQGDPIFNHRHDFVSGPIAVGGKYWFTHPAPMQIASWYPLQFAATSDLSQRWLEPFLVDILREKRIEDPSQSQTLSLNPDDWPPLGSQ